METWKDLWDQRQAALESVLGKAENRVFHSPIPFNLGGNADVLLFRHFTQGYAYVTAELTGTDQPKNDFGQYELMICTRTEQSWAPNLISRLARYTLEHPLCWGQTMDIGPALPKGSTIAAFLFAPPSLEGYFDGQVPMQYGVEGKSCNLVLCLGITAQELSACRTNAYESLETLKKLRDRSIYPCTDLTRASVT